MRSLSAAAVAALVVAPVIARADVHAGRVAAGISASTASTGFNWSTSGGTSEVDLGLTGMGLYALTDMVQVGGDVGLFVQSYSRLTNATFVLAPTVKLNFAPRQKLNPWAGASAIVTASSATGSTFGIALRGGVEYFVSPDWSLLAWPELGVTFTNPAFISFGVHYGLLVYLP